MPMSETVEMLQAILGTIDEGIHVVDANGITIYYNHVAARLDGLTPDEVLGKPLLEVFPSLDRHSSTLLRVIASGEPIYDQPQTYTNWRGMRVETINTTLPVRVGNRLVGAVEVAKDIRKLKELSERLLDLQAQISKPKRAKRSKLDGDGLSFQFADILTQNEQMMRLKDRARKAARTSSPVLIYGETGTGKELFVQSIHQASSRCGKPFIAQNCAALPASLLESLLFGTTKGSFTGADDRPGLFELADGGTLFLDELNSMPLDLQAKLLRVLQDGQIRRIGSSSAVRVDVRVIAAVNEPPLELVRRGALRLDLYYRINVVSFELPPLRERREDVDLLVRHFLDKYNRRFHMQVQNISPEVADLFRQYDWPGNVRELEHVIEAAMNMVEGAVIEREHLPPYLAERSLVNGPGETGPGEIGSAIPPIEAWAAKQRTLPEVLREVEERCIADALKSTGGNVLRAARLLGIPRQTLQYKLSQRGAGER
ncbi:MULTISPECIES: sigma-54-dependent Fis family transcriptional regulator [Bacillales]|jgi:arginine utilization regulatory protein|uniref:PAS domain S-box protein n=1 Tax=Brevibacillus aydinogluensis TaxID=927786 RepID=A0AA48M565_9BACL|nr:MULTISPECIES: sigma 54-interacting transcriptional regulator [Bacillales]REK60661.1 MAG: sigma-54-dependent Fis family transcriptional regulator [Brevibacillus sp.]MBR8659788.1 sigma 54-interacting transcriptional regulator [Brevibacillus sp. NL20B1]MDT3416610.1 arginine utilization regulatory protein [Brevibacillus aydinogluensis]NNV01228.1 PAS domain S-box protein [Brevibacillus sp. MCWH]UFJ62068.1 sigma 54-interacting transcriptional regulator [Anoxybacillus sediminis]